MSALGIWNNRYEGGPCYAACMETFTLYFFSHKATIPPLQSAGRVATMQLAEWMNQLEEMRQNVCAKDLPLSLWQQKLDNLSQLLISESTQKCSPLSLKISTGPVLLAFDARDTDNIINTKLSFSNPNPNCISTSFNSISFY